MILTTEKKCFSHWIFFVLTYKMFFKNLQRNMKLLEQISLFPHLSSSSISYPLHISYFLPLAQEYSELMPLL